MSSQKYLKFSSKGKTGQVLSNFSNLQVVIDGKTYKTGEHAFHGNKYFTASELYDSTNTKRKKKLIDYSNKFVGEESEFETPLDAKKAGSKTKFKLKESEIQAWSKNSINVQKEINEYKFKTYPEVREVLGKYSDRNLLHQDNRAKPDTLWGARISKEDGSIIGQNILGKMWEETRKEMMGKESSKTPSPIQEEEESSNPTPLIQEESSNPTPLIQVVDEEGEISKPIISIQDDVPMDDFEVTHIELPDVKQDKQSKKKKISIYNKNILKKTINVHISEIGSNLTEIIEEKTRIKYENICIIDGFIKKNSIQLITYSSGIVENSYISFDVEFEAMIFRPVEGMIIYNCIVDNISRAGIKARTNEDISPAVIFIAKDHAYNSEFFNSINEEDNINIKVIGHRYELKDSKISIIGSLVEKKNIKIVLKK